MDLSWLEESRQAESFCLVGDRAKMTTATLRTHEEIDSWYLFAEEAETSRGL